MFPSRVNEKLFLNTLGSFIDAKEFKALDCESGFSFPNTFRAEDVESPLRQGEFPREDYYEFLWAISEYGLETQNKLSPYMNIYLSAIYIYCYKLNGHGLELEIDYYYQFIKTLLDINKTDVTLTGLLFLERVAKHGEEDDYLSLLAWLLLSFSLEDFNDNVLEHITGSTLKKAAVRDVKMEVVGAVGREHWMTLLNKVNVPNKYKESIIELIGKIYYWQAP